MRVYTLYSPVGLTGGNMRIVVERLVSGRT